MKATLLRGLAALALATALAGCGTTRARTVEIDSPPNSRAVLTASAWSLTELDGQPISVPAGASAPNIHFDRSSQRVTGNAGVNRFNGGYTIDGDSLQFSPLAATRMAGPEELNALETRFLEALQQSDRWRIQGDALQLLAGEQVKAQFKMMPLPEPGRR